MRLLGKLAVVGIAGIGIGAVGTHALNAQSAPPAFLVAEVQVTDPDAYRPYIPKAAEIVAKHGGHYLARGGKLESLEGAEPAGRVAIVQFPSLAALKKFYDSPEYREAAQVRQKNSKSRFFAVEGISR
jgi:uncharacterized protein (DUF1330 family)